MLYFVCFVSSTVALCCSASIIKEGGCLSDPNVIVLTLTSVSRALLSISWFVPFRTVCFISPRFLFRFASFYFPCAKIVSICCLSPPYFAVFFRCARDTTCSYYPDQVSIVDGDAPKALVEADVVVEGELKVFTLFTVKISSISEIVCVTCSL